jgi:ABC-type Fe3+ transport system permease subunit
LLRREPFLISQLVAVYLFYISFLLIPIAYVLSTAFHADISSLLVNPKYISLHVAQEPIVQYVKPDGRVIYIIRGFNYGVIPNSLLIASIVTVISIVLGTFLSLIVSRYIFPLKNLLRLFLYIPMLPAPFINAFVAFKLFDPVYGFIPWLMTEFLGLPWGIGFQEMAGVILAQVMAFYPIAYLNISASMLSQDPSAEEQAENLGSRGFTLFRSITFPLSMPGVMAAASTIFIFSLEDLGGPIAFKFRQTISYEIYSSFRQASTGSISPITAFLALILLTISISFFILSRELASRKQYALLSKSGRPYMSFKKPGDFWIIVIYLIVSPLVIFTSLPQIGVIVFALAGPTWLRSPIPLEISPRFIIDAFSDPIAIRALYNSLIYSGAALVIMVLVAVSIAYTSSRFRSTATIAIDTISMSALTIPGLVVALGYLYYFMDLSSLLGFNYLDSVQALAISIILAYSVRKAPFAIRAAYAGMQQIHVSLEEAAANLGSRRIGIIARITLPLTKLSIASGALMGWVYAFSEVSVSVTLGGIAAVGVNHAAPMTFIMSDYIANKVQAVAVAASLGVILILTELVAIAIVGYLTKQRFAAVSIA